MMGLEVLTRLLAAVAFALLWLLCACAWILLPIPAGVRWSGLVVIGGAIWLQHRPRRRGAR
jgi:hypothetical protein